MKQAITTKFLGATNTKGSRIKATCEGGSIITHYRHEFNSDENAYIAAKKLQNKLKWNYDLLIGSLGNSYVFIQVDVNNDTKYKKLNK